MKYLGHLDSDKVIWRKPKWRMHYSDWIAYPSYAYLIKKVNNRRPKK